MGKEFNVGIELECSCGENALYNTSYVPTDVFEDKEVIENVENVHSFICLNCETEYIVITLLNGATIVIERELDVEVEDKE